jgi:hypothetical protein
MNAVVHVKRNAKLYAVGEVAGWYADYLRLSKKNYIGHKITVNPDEVVTLAVLRTSDFSILKANGFDVVAPKKNQLRKSERC